MGQSNEYLNRESKSFNIKDIYIDVFLIGNYSNKTLEKLVGEKTTKKTKSDFSYYEHPYYKWKFFLSEKEKIKSFIEKKSIANENNNVIIYFSDKIKEDEKEFIKSISDAKVHEPCIIFILNDTSNVSYEEFESFGFFQKMAFINKNEDYLIENIYEELLKSSFYLNQLGDVINFPKIKPEINNIHNSNSISETIQNEVEYANVNESEENNFLGTFNIMLVGQPGSGKSSFINYFMGEKKAKEGLGLSITSEIARYVHKKYPISLFDTPGLENKTYSDQVLTKIIKYKDDLEKYKEKINLLFFIMNGALKRTLTNYEIELLNKIIKMNIKIFFLINMCSSQEESKEFVAALKLFLIQKQLVKNESNNFDLLDHIYVINFKKRSYKEKFGLNKLYNDIYKEYEKDKIPIDQLKQIESNDEILKIIKKSRFADLIDDINDIIKILKIKAGSIIASFIFLCIGLASNPIPAIEFFAFPIIQAGLIGALMKLYKTKISKDILIKTLKKTVPSFSTAFIVSSTFGFFKLLPPFGQVIAQIANSLILPSTCGVIGAQCIKLFEEEMLKGGYKEYMIKLLECYNQAVDAFKEKAEEED